MTRELPVVDARPRSGSTEAPTSSSSSRSPTAGRARRSGSRGTHPDLVGQLGAWCRQQGHRCRAADADLDAGRGRRLERGAAAGARWVGAERSGPTPIPAAGAVVDRAACRAGVSPPGAPPSSPVARRPRVPARPTATMSGPTGPPASTPRRPPPSGTPPPPIDWACTIAHGRRVEAAVVQVMTFLVENEEAALVVPARFLGQVHPHFREIQQIARDHRRRRSPPHRGLHPTRHDRPATSSRSPPSAAGPRCRPCSTSPTTPSPSFLLSVMGEGTFVSLLSFLERHAPDPITRRIAHLTRNDEARHVAFSLAHLDRHAAHRPRPRRRLARAVERRHQRPAAHLRTQRRRLRRPRAARRRRRHARDDRRRMAARADPAGGDGRRPPGPPRPSRLHRRPRPRRISSLHTRNFM